MKHHNYQKSQGIINHALGFFCIFAATYSIKMEQFENQLHNDFML